MNKNLSPDPISNIDDAYPSKYFKSADLDDGPLHLAISGFGMESVRGGDGTEQLKPVLRFRGAEKGVVLNVTNKECLKRAFGNKADDWMGRVIEMYQTEVTFGGKVVPGIRMRAIPAAAARAAGPVAVPEVESELPF